MIEHRPCLNVFFLEFKVMIRYFKNKPPLFKLNNDHNMIIIKHNPKEVGLGIPRFYLCIGHKIRLFNTIANIKYCKFMKFKMRRGTPKKLLKGGN